MKEMKSPIRLQKVTTFADELAQMRDHIMRRAYEIFERDGHPLDRAFDHWLAAEDELTWRPPIQLCEREKEFDVQIALAGFEPEDLDIRITPEELLVTAERSHRHRADQGTVHTCEFRSGRLFRSIRFPHKIDPDRVAAEFKNGLLRVTAAIARDTEARKLEVRAV